MIPYQRWRRVEAIYIMHILKLAHMSNILSDTSSLPSLQLTNYHTTEHIMA